MSQQLIGLGSSANDGNGDSLRVAGAKINDNFTELYQFSGSLAASGIPVETGNYTIISGTNVQSNLDSIDSRLSGLVEQDPVLISNLGSGVLNFLQTPSSSNFASAITDETGSGKVVFNNSPIFSGNITTPAILAPSSGAGAIGASGASYTGLYLSSGATINFGSDTQITRPSSGQIAIEGRNVFISGKSTAHEIQLPQVITLTSSGTSAYAGTAGVTATAYNTADTYVFVSNFANTGAATLNVDSLGPKTIKKVAGGITTDLSANDIRSGQVCLVSYDGTNFQIQSTLGNASSAASGTWVLLGADDASGGAKSALTVDNVVSSSYDRYQIVLQRAAPATDNVGSEIILRSSTPANIGGTYKSGYSGIGINASGTAAGSNITGTNGFRIIPDNGNSTDEETSGIWTIDLSTNSSFKELLGQCLVVNLSSQRFSLIHGGYNSDTTAVAGFSFAFTSGNVASGWMKVFGLKK